jgi:ABC-type sugar transport system ATPase subunit
LRCSDRIVVLRDQEKITELTGAEMDDNIIMRTIAGS